MEWAKPNEISSALFQADVLAHEIDDIRRFAYSVYLIGGYSHRIIEWSKGGLLF